MSQIWVNIYLPLWVSGQMTNEQLLLAASKGRISHSEYDYIISQPQILG